MERVGTAIDSIICLFKFVWSAGLRLLDAGCIIMSEHSVFRLSAKRTLEKRCLSNNTITYGMCLQA
jgi:hypothetical protein